MRKIKLVHADAAEYTASADLILTDPPYNMPAHQLLAILDNYASKHLVLIATMSQLAGVFKYGNWDLAFDFVLDAVVPKQSKSSKQPNYTHQNGVYLKKPGTPSLFDRKRRPRSDTFDGKGYWPTVIRAPRNRMVDHGMAKNEQAITDILGSFEIESVLDPFGGSGTTALAAFELGLDCIIVEKDFDQFQRLKDTLKFMGAFLN